MQDAVALEAEGNYEAAIDAYGRALHNFQHERKYSSIPTYQKAMAEQMTKIMDRIEQLQSMPPPPPPGSRPRTNKGKAPGKSGRRSPPGVGGGGHDPDSISSLSTDPHHNNNNNNNNNNDDQSEEPADEAGAAGSSNETDRMREELEKTIFHRSPQLQEWNEVVGMDSAKASLEEALMPQRYPQFFQDGGLEPWTGILLYGPPGTGKTLLARAVASHSKMNFITVSSTDIVSKWVGDSEKLVRCTFEIARKHAPCVIFIDEVDSLCSTRSDSDNDSSRRIKNEFLTQLDGVLRESNEGVVFLGATNRPWDLDVAMRRRFDKRILVDLPGASARGQMFAIKMHRISHNLEDEDFLRLGEMTKGHTGSDIRNVVKDAAYEPVREVLNARYFRAVFMGEDQPELFTPCRPDDPGAMEVRAKDLDPQMIMARPCTMSDFEAAMQRSKPSLGEVDMSKFHEWTEQYGERGN